MTVECAALRRLGIHSVFLGHNAAAETWLEKSLEADPEWNDFSPS